MLKKLLLTTVLMSSSALHVVFAAAPTDASVQKALELSHVNRLLDESIKSVGVVLEQQAVEIVQKKTGHQTLNSQEQKAAQDIAQIVKNNTNQIIQQADLPQLTAQLFKKYYSEEELQVFIKFLESPEGQSINNKQPLVAQEVTQTLMKSLSNPQFRSNQAKLSQEVNNILNSLPKAH